MCKFFSLISNGKGKVLYFDAKVRKKIKSDKLNYEQDSHTSIADFNNIKGAAEDKWNKWEYNPLTKELKIDEYFNTTDDTKLVKEFCEKLDFKTVIPELIIKPIINPFKDIIPPKKITNEHIKMLKQWASVRDSVRDSVRASVRDSVRASVRDSVRASVRDSVGDSVGASVWDSVWDSVWAYIGSFFNLPRKSWKYTSKIKCKGYPFEPAVKLCMMGLVPSFDGTVWRLHGGSEANVLFEISAEELRSGKKVRE